MLGVTKFIFELQIDLEYSALDLSKHQEWWTLLTKSCKKHANVKTLAMRILKNGRRHVDAFFDFYGSSIGV